VGTKGSPAGVNDDGSADALCVWKGKEVDSCAREVEGARLGGGVMRAGFAFVGASEELTGTIPLGMVLAVGIIMGVMGADAILSTAAAAVE